MENYNYEINHAGIKGMKWGRRRFQNKDGTLTPAGKQRYSSTSLKAVRARRANEKVDKSFKKWEEGAKNRDNAIDLGKKKNAAKLAYENDKSNKDLKTAYKTANKEYEKALKTNTAYRKGSVREQVGRDAARKYLSEAKKVKKQLDSDPSNKALQKKYNDLMSKHDIERADARRAQSVGQKRSRKVASIKRNMTITTAAVSSAAAIAGGTYAVNRYLSRHDVTIEGRSVRLGKETVSKVVDVAKKVKGALGYMY